MLVSLGFPDVTGLDLESVQPPRLVPRRCRRQNLPRSDAGRQIGRRLHYGPGHIRHREIVRRHCRPRSGASRPSPVAPNWRTRGGAALEQIQLCLGHASLITTQLYLGLHLDLKDAPCDHHLGLPNRRGWANVNSSPFDTSMVCFFLFAVSWRRPFVVPISCRKPEPAVRGPAILRWAPQEFNEPSDLIQIAVKLVKVSCLEVSFSTVLVETALTMVSSD